MHIFVRILVLPLERANADTIARAYISVATLSTSSAKVISTHHL
jgi:hypothetical protein